MECENGEKNIALDTFHRQSIVRIRLLQKYFAACNKKENSQIWILEKGSEWRMAPLLYFTYGWVAVDPL